MIMGKILIVFQSLSVILIIVQDLKFIITVSADVLAPNGARPSADTELNEESNAIQRKWCDISCVQLVLYSCGYNN